VARLLPAAPHGDRTGMGKRKKTGRLTSSHVNYTAHRGLLGTRTVTANLTQIRRERLAHEQERQEKLNG
jgi:hypothetical protein